MAALAAPAREVKPPDTLSFSTAEWLLSTSLEAALAAWTCCLSSAPAQQPQQTILRPCMQEYLATGTSYRGLSQDPQVWVHVLQAAQKCQYASGCIPASACRMLREHSGSRIVNQGGLPHLWMSCPAGLRKPRRAALPSWLKPPLQPPARWSFQPAHAECKHLVRGASDLHSDDSSWTMKISRS